MQTTEQRAKMSSPGLQIHLQTHCGQSNAGKHEQLTNKIALFSGHVALYIDRILMLIGLVKDHCLRSLQLDEDQVIRGRTYSFQNTFADSALAIVRKFAGFTRSGILGVLQAVTVRKPGNE